MLVLVDTFTEDADCLFCSGLKIKFRVGNLEPIFTRVLKEIPERGDPLAQGLFLRLSLLPVSSGQESGAMG